MKLKAGFKKTKVGVIPMDWDCEVFSKIFNRISKPVIPKLDEVYREIGIRSHGKGIFHKPTVTGKQLGNKRVFNIEVGTLVFNIVFAWEQAVAIISEKEKGFIASHRFPMFSANPDIGYESFFLKYFQTPRGKHGLGVASPGGAGRNKTLGQRELDFLYIPVPPISEQKAIADTLFIWDKAIEKTQALIAAKEKQFKWLLKTLISDQAGKPGWRKVKLGDIAEIRIGRTPSRKISKYWDRNKKTNNIWLSIADLSKGYFIFDSKEYVSNIAIIECNMNIVPENTVVISYKLTIGRTCLLKNAAFTNEAIAALIPVNDNIFSPHFLLYLLPIEILIILQLG